MFARDRVIWLLRTYYDVRELWDPRSAGDGVRLMPRMWHEGSYAELERVLANLRDSSQRPLWFHATRRYRDGEWVTLLVGVRRRAKGPEFLLPQRVELPRGAVVIGQYTAAVRAYRWSSEVEQQKADQGVELLAERMYDGDRERIVLPDFYYRRVLGLPARDAA